ncbi:MAG: hypothetical protein J6K51_04290 [Clostridia bacterium]|nr:hypothetical protein [Clostridia bacterium]
MKSKRILSLLLSLIMIISMSTDALAFTLNMTSGINDVIQVETGTEQFFNVIFQEKEWEPNAEQVYTMYMGQNYDMWRYSGGMNTR